MTIETINECRMLLLDALEDFSAVATLLRESSEWKDDHDCMENTMHEASNAAADAANKLKAIAVKLSQ